MNNNNYISTGQATSDETVKAIMTPGGLLDMMTTNDKKTVEEDYKENSL